MKAKGPKKADATRAKIVDIAMRLFLDQGFEKTTMREIAAAAGLAPGAAYYHFESKEHMVFGFYEMSYQKHLAEAEQILGTEKDLSKRIAGEIKAHLKVSEPYFEISKVLFRIAADPKHPVSPFSKESKDLRDRNIELMKRCLEGQKLDKDLAAKLPELLWMFKMGMILYWLHDLSPKHAKTYKFVDQASSLVATLIQLSKLPVLGGFSKKAVAIFEEYKIF
jgi:AcrR family transcriptional regulator